MKLVFAGPSLHRFRRPETTSIDFRGPALQGDVYEAVEAGAGVIGIIDGFFESVSSVWHKEILYALSQGVQVFGASSMGALRAAECADFGMIGVGRIFEAYRDGSLVDDEAVALSHGPAELGHMPLTVPLVNVMWSTEHWLALGMITSDERDRLLDAARRIFFKDRTWIHIVADAALPPGRRDEMLAIAKSSSVDRKGLDAQELIERIENTDGERVPAPQWSFSHTDQFARFLAGSRRNEPAI
jgi:hypothetical protein